MNQTNHQDSTNVTMTKRAALKLKELQKVQGNERNGIRFGVKKGFCGQGFEYVMDFASQPEPEDKIFYSGGIEIYVNELSFSKVCGSVIDFQNGSPNERLELLMREGFTIQNPNAKAACPCACDRGFDC